jgi:hypothetical protein
LICKVRPASTRHNLHANAAKFTIPRGDHMAAVATLQRPIRSICRMPFGADTVSMRHSFCYVAVVAS